MHVIHFLVIEQIYLRICQDFDPHRCVHESVGRNEIPVHILSASSFRDYRNSGKQ